MTLSDEARFRHLAGSIATYAHQLQVDPITKHTPETLIRMEGWLSEMASLYAQGASRLPAKRRKRTHETNP